MATSDEMAWTPESNLHDLLNDENMKALDDLFDFSQYGPSLLGAWEPPELEDGDHDRQRLAAQPSYAGALNFAAQLPGVSVAETSHSRFVAAAVVLA